MRSINTNRIGAGLAAVAFMAASSLGTVANVAAVIDYCDKESSAYDYYMCNLKSVSNAPAGTMVVAGPDLEHDRAETEQLAYGKYYDDYIALLNSFDSIEGNDAKKQAFLATIADKISYFAMSKSFIDFHLVDEDGNKVQNEPGRYVAIRFYDEDGRWRIPSDIQWIFDEDTEHEWEYGFLHIKDDGTREYITADYFNDGKTWNLAVDDFSLFMPIYRVIDPCGSKDFDVQCGLVDYQGAPAGTEMVVETAGDDLDWTERTKIILGEDGYKKYEELDEKWDDEDEEANLKLMLKLFGDEIGYFPIGDDLYDFHLVDEDTGEEVHSNGEKIQITYKSEYWKVHSDVAWMFEEDTEREWEYAMLHIKDDGSREFIPAEVEFDGGDAIWRFETDDFSVFVPVLKVVTEDVEPAKTGDNMLAYIGLVAVSLAAFTSFGMYIRKTRR